MRKILAILCVSLVVTAATACSAQRPSGAVQSGTPSAAPVQSAAAASDVAATPAQTPASSAAQPSPSEPAKPLLKEADVDKNATEILIESKTITSLDFLADCKNVLRLSISNCTIRDGVVLPEIGSLESLNVGSCGPSALTVIRNNTQVPALALEGDELTDISALKGFNNLKRLDLIDNDITDLGPLAGLENLERLILVGGNENITSLKPLYGLMKLKDIEVNNKAYQNIAREDLVHFGSDPDAMNKGNGIVRVD